MTYYQHCKNWGSLNHKNLKLLPGKQFKTESGRLHSLESFNLSRRYECVMNWHAQWAGDWSDYHESYRWHPLCGDHRALDDCLAVLERMKKMAADSDKFHCPVPRPE